jgi:hypothetical protein
MPELQTVDASEQSGLLLGVREQRGVKTRSGLSTAAVGWWPRWDDGDGFDGWSDADGWDGDGGWGDGWDGDY